MGFLKFTLFSLLIAAPGSLVFGDNMITCYSDVQHLSCAQGLIIVTSTVYGRTDRVTCSTNRPNSQVSTTTCSSAVSSIAKSCNGLQECEVKTDLLGDSDPCVGTYKYYNTTYHCFNGYLKVICEHGYSTLDCGNNAIQIINANYGRTDSVTCSEGLPNRSTQKTNCYASNTLSILSALCNGQKKCTVEASYTIYSDPCAGTAKYLTVSYICTIQTVACEGSVASLDCGTQRIMIVWANYGRTDSTTCSTGRPSSQVSNKNCYSSNTLSTVSSVCDGQNSCSITASNSVFSDPCGGTYKYLSIVYGCIMKRHVDQVRARRINIDTEPDENNRPPDVSMRMPEIKSLEVDNATVQESKEVMDVTVQECAVLLVAPGLLVSGVVFFSENTITCYGDVQRLTCDTGLIMVNSSLYGRTDNSTCITGKRPAQVANTRCSLSISTVADRCNGLRVCELKTDLLGNPDPCFGTYKYYNTTYDCISGRVVVICEQGYSTLDCENDSIKIINANFGRHDSFTCSNGLPCNATHNTNCYAKNTSSIVAALCNGQKRCTLEASSTIFTDPCNGTSKYLTVSYRCTPTSREIVTCEGSTAKLTCGSQHITIISANYGRTSSTTCSSGRPASQISDTKCNASDTLNKVKARCEGKCSCEVPATNDVFSDPCYGTYKYLTVVYSCNYLITHGILSSVAFLQSEKSN
ncbi:uncharacterized protein Hap1MRO34_011288 [Clarias gariepinus]